MAIITPSTITLIHGLTLCALSILSGVALSLRVWTIPTILRSSPNTAVQVRQFDAIIDLGLRYLQTTSRVLPVLMLSLATMTYQYHRSQSQHDQLAQKLVSSSGGGVAVAQEWTHYIAALVPLVLIGPYEVFLIFPINDKIAEYGKNLVREKGEKAGRFEDKRDDEIQQLIHQWQWWHVGRIVAPMISAMMLVMSGAGLLPNF